MFIYIYFIYVSIYLERGKQNKKDFPSAGSSLNAGNGQDWDKLKPGAHNSTQGSTPAHMDARGPSVEVIVPCLPVCTSRKLDWK